MLTDRYLIVIARAWLNFTSYWGFLLRVCLNVLCVHYIHLHYYIYMHACITYIYIYIFGRNYEDYSLKWRLLYIQGDCCIYNIVKADTREISTYKLKRLCRVYSSCRRKNSLFLFAVKFKKIIYNTLVNLAHFRILSRQRNRKRKEK